MDAVVNIDLEKRCDFKNIKSLDIIRIGTCGILQPTVPLHSYILTNYAYGLDNVAHFYDLNYTDIEIKLKNNLNKHMGSVIPSEVNTYVSSASPNMINKLTSNLTIPAITVTAPGFYGPQGRHLRLNTKTNKMNELLMSFNNDSSSSNNDGVDSTTTDDNNSSTDTTTTTDSTSLSDINTQKVVNFEMESSALYALGKHLGHNTATICLGIANRSIGAFSSDSTPYMLNMIEYVLDRI